MSRVLAFIQNLSLDVTAGAVISSWFVCDYFEVEASWQMMLGLGIAIWLIYTIDHLRDAVKPERAANPRHAFHSKHKGLISIVAALAFAIGVMNAFALSKSTIQYGLILGVLSGLYFLYLRFSKEQRLKEFFAAVIYTSGIFAGPASLVAQWDWFYLLFFMLFFLLVAANLVLFPLYEMEIDDKDDVKSIALKGGVSRTRKLVWSLLSLHFVLLTVSLWLTPSFYQQVCVFAAMNMILIVLLAKQDAFRKHQMYRWLGDGIFFFPIAILLFI